MPPRDERDFLVMWRWVALAVVTLLIVFTVLIDNLGRLFLDPGFHVSEVMFGTLVTTWVIMLGLDVIRRIRANGNGNGNGGAAT